MNRGGVNIDIERLGEITGAINVAIIHIECIAALCIAKSRCSRFLVGLHGQ
jgi:hypothetical protein